MRTKFFLRYFIGFLRPLIIFLLIFSVPSVIILWSYSTRLVHKTNSDLLALTKANIEQVLDESNFLLFSLDKNTRTRMEVKDFFRTEEFTYEKMRTYETLKNTISVPANMNTHLHSVYAYLENPWGIFVASNYGQARLDVYPDAAWHESYEAHPRSEVWVERREVHIYPFVREAETVISLYRKFSSMPGAVILNISEDYFLELTRERGAFAEQYFAIVNGDASLAFSNWEDMPEVWPQVSGWKDEAGNRIVGVEGTRYVLASEYSREYGWYYVSMVPVYSAYGVPYTMLLLTGAALAAAILIGAAVSYYQARKNYTWLEGMVHMLTAAEREGQTPNIANAAGDIYALIVQHVTRVFHEGNNLKLQVVQHKLAEEKAELQALQLQLNPHFIYNTLEYINQQLLSIHSRPTAVNAMVQDLSRILRYSLDTPEKMIPFYEEYENTCRYISIMRHRHEDKLKVSWKLQPDIMEYSVLKFILQLLVENAIKHGFKYPKTHIAIRVSVRENDDGALQLEVLDTGMGMGRSELKTLRAGLESPENTGHIGLKNLNRRLALAYSGQYRLRIISSRGRGTSVKLSVPLAFHNPEG